MARKLGIVGATLALSLAAALAQATPRFADEVAALRAIEQGIPSPDAAAEPLKARFTTTHDAFAAANESQLDDDDLRDYFEAAYIVAFYAHDRRSVESMRAALDALARRGIDSDAQRQSVADMYIEARLVPEALAFAREPANARLVPLPAFAADDGTAAAPTLWHLSADGTTVERDTFAFDAAPRVLVVSSPWCHFTHDATVAIAADPELAALMKRHSTWIMPQQRIRDFAEIAKWDRDYPGWPMQVMYDASEWPIFPTSATPVFYFVDDGRISETITGWPSDAQKDKLRVAFAKAALK